MKTVCPAQRMVFIRSGRVSGSPVLVLRAHRYFTKPWLPRYPASALLPRNLTRISALLSGAFLSSAARNSMALFAGFSLSLRSPIWEQPPLPALLLPCRRSTLSTERAAPSRQKPRYPRSNFTTKTSQCHLQREGGLMEQNARQFKPIRYLPDANPTVERERLY